MVRYDVSLSTAIQNYAGLVVCSAGNETANNDVTDHYPSSYSLPNLIAVGASTEANQPSSSSNFGKTTVDIFYPGNSIYSTYRNNDHRVLSGTSMAAPFVTGVAALILSLHPDKSGEELKDIIMNRVDVVYSNGSSVFANLCVSGGKINAYKAVTSDLLHSYSANDTSTAGHNCTHSRCSYVEPHEYTVSKYSTQKHKLTCSFCGYYIYELHSWKLGGNTCRVCGFNTEGSTVLRTEKIATVQTCCID